MNLNYNQNIPGSQNNPSDDQPLMRTNTNSTRTWVTIDHHGFKDNLGGYHTIIHQDNGTPTRTIDRITGINTNIPAAISGIHQLFSALVTTPDGSDTQLISVTGNQAPGQFSQLTGNHASSEGWGWFSGLLVQWGGVVTGLNNTTNSVVFATRTAGMIEFPNNLFVVIPNPFYDSSGTSTPTSQRTATVSIDINATNTNKTQFTWKAQSSSTSSTNNYSGFYWIAVGN